MTAHQFAAATAVISPAVAAVWISHTEPVPDHAAGRFWLAAWLLGVLGYAASFLLYNYAITRVQSGPASVILNLIPVFGLAGAVPGLADHPPTGGRRPDRDVSHHLRCRRVRCKPARRERTELGIRHALRREHGDAEVVQINPPSESGIRA